MKVVYYVCHKGGINNVAIALDSDSGEFSASTRDKKHAMKALNRKLKKNNERTGTNQ